jgi:5'(3')-deoxyribonucleotidase
MLSILRDDYGVTLSPDEVIHANLDVFLPPGKSAEFWGKVGTPGLHKQFRPYSGAQEGFARLVEIADVYIVTSHLSSGSTWVHERDAWLAAHFGVPRSNITHTPAKYLFFGDALVDDTLDKLEGWKSYHPEGLAIIFDRPYNRDVEEDKIAQYERACSWEDVIRLVQEKCPRLITTTASPPPPMVTASVAYWLSTNVELKDLKTYLERTALAILSTQARSNYMGYDKDIFRKEVSRQLGEAFAHLLAF